MNHAKPHVKHETRIKNEYRRQFSMTLVMAVHFLLSCGLFFVFWLLFRYGSLKTGGYGYRYNYYITALYAFLLFFFNRAYNSYLFGYSRIRSLIFSQFISQLFSLILIYLVTAIAWKKWNSPLFLFPLPVLNLILDVLFSYYGNGYYCRLNPAKRSIVVYRNNVDRRRLGSIHGKPTERLYKIEKEIQFTGKHFDELKPELAGFEAVFVAGIDSRVRNGILKYCKEEGIAGFFLPHVGDVIMREATHIQAFDSPVLHVGRTVLRPEYMLIKRAFDIVSSGLALILLSPLMLITALAIKMYDGGPAFYKQTRLTQYGREFEIIKFRSRRVDAEKDGIARLSTGENDPRITPIGRIVRKCRLDELPQLINILKGDMSVVGPRPERPEIAEKYYEKLPDFKLRLQVKAGLTGYAQVYGKYNTEPYEKLEFDLLYINDMNMLTDLKLCFATFGILFKPESTEGVDVNQITAVDYDEMM